MDANCLACKKGVSKDVYCAKNLNVQTKFTNAVNNTLEDPY